MLVTEAKIGRVIRQKIADEIRANIENSGGFVVLSYDRLPANVLNDFRKKVRDAGAKLLVAKKSLVKLAVRDMGREEAEKIVDGQSAFAFPGEDVISFAKVVMDFVSENSKVITLYGGFLEGVIYDKQKIEALSKLPSKEYVIAQAIGTIKAPLSRMVGAISGILSKLVYVVKAIEEKKKEQK